MYYTNGRYVYRVYGIPPGSRAWEGNHPVTGERYHVDPVPIEYYAYAPVFVTGTYQYNILTLNYYYSYWTYYEHYGNLEIPKSFKTTNGYEYEENGIKLGQWIATQRLAFQGKNKVK